MTAADRMMQNSPCPGNRRLWRPLTVLDWVHRGLRSASSVPGGELSLRQDRHSKTSTGPFSKRWHIDNVLELP
eukprot:7284604-Lingulodinium_polyedra.AAC.1